MILPVEARKVLLELARDRGIYLEGNILKLIDAEADADFARYLREAIDKDGSSRRKRLEITRQVQQQNRELHDAHSKLTDALKAAENAKAAAQQDLDLLQKRTQFRLMYRVVMVALGLIVGVGVSTTLLYIFALLTNKDTALLGNAWSSMFGILLTNSFSIIGTLMGVKYAAESKSD